MTKVYQHIRSQLVPLVAERIMYVCSITKENDVLVWCDTGRTEAREALLKPLMTHESTFGYTQAKKLVKGFREIVHRAIEAFTHETFAIAQHKLDTQPWPTIYDWFWLSIIQDAIGYKGAIPTNTSITLTPSTANAFALWDLTVHFQNWETDERMSKFIQLDGHGSDVANERLMAAMKRLYKIQCDQQSASLAWLTRNLSEYQTRNGNIVFGKPSTVQDYYETMDLDQYETRYHA